MQENAKDINGGFLSSRLNETGPNCIDGILSKRKGINQLKSRMLVFYETIQSYIIACMAS